MSSFMPTPNMLMRSTLLALAAVTLTPFSLEAHDGLLAQNAVAPPDTASVTQNVKMGGGTHQFKSVAGWCEIPTSAGAVLGATHGGIVVDKAGLIYFSTDTDRSIMVYSPEANTSGPSIPNSAAAMASRSTRPMGSSSSTQRISRGARWSNSIWTALPC